MKTGIQAIILKIQEDSDNHSSERYSKVISATDRDIEAENALHREEMDKQRDLLKKTNKHEHERRLEYQRSRLNRELLAYQRELTDEVFDMAVAKLRKTPNQVFARIFKSSVSGLRGSYSLHLGALSEGKLDSRSVEEAMEENDGLAIALSAESIPNKSGFVLRDDRVEYDHLFEDLVEDVKSERMATIMKEIFGNTSDWMFT